MEKRRGYKRRGEEKRCLPGGGVGVWSAPRLKNPPEGGATAEEDAGSSFFGVGSVGGGVALGW